MNAQILILRHYAPNAPIHNAIATIYVRPDGFRISPELHDEMVNKGYTVISCQARDVPDIEADIRDYIK